MGRKKSLIDKYPQSPSCACDVCVSYCQRPGWWTVDEASAALEAGYGTRMMLEMAPMNAFGVLSPAFKGNEVDFAVAEFSGRGCTFLSGGRCELYETGHEPLECRYCHHDRLGQGTRCHEDIGKQWNSPAGRALIVEWSNRTGFWQKHRVGSGD
ncbi:MAG TPA: hypothetical protein VFH29_04240 [Anaerolineales bacterium]|nr:hypothetical protein [Anaerolineales bacterium]